MISELRTTEIVTICMHGVGMHLIEASFVAQPVEPKHSWNFTYRDTDSTVCKRTVVVPDELGYEGKEFGFYAFQEIFKPTPEKKATPEEIIERLTELTEGEAVLYDNYEAALVGICYRFNQLPIALYDRNKCLQILIDGDDGPDHEDNDAYTRAMEWFEYNTIGAWVGEYTPAFTDSGYA